MTLTVEITAKDEIFQEIIEESDLELIIQQRYPLLKIESLEIIDKSL